MAKQLLHLVMGGRVTDPQGVEFQNLDEIDLVGVYPNYAAAEEVWRGKAQGTVSARSEPRTPAGWGDSPNRTPSRRITRPVTGFPTRP